MLIKIQRTSYCARTFFLFWKIRSELILGKSLKAFLNKACLFSIDGCIHCCHAVNALMFMLEPYCPLRF